MIGDSLSPTPRQRAEEILRRLAPVEREALLVSTYRQAFWSRASRVRVVAAVSPQ